MYKHKKCGGKISSPVITLAFTVFDSDGSGNIDTSFMDAITYQVKCYKCGKTFSIGESGKYTHISEIATKGV